MMTKTQGWVIIILLFLIIGMFMVRNQNEFDEQNNKLSACYEKCSKTYYEVADKTKTIEQAISESNICHDECNTEQGLKPSWSK
jgi:acyl-CoA synthetase (AMP-forming)/AMP-acid ligase II